MRISPARTAAFEALARIETKRAFSSIVLPQVEDGLSPADRGLCHELVLGVLRRRMWLDRAIDSLVGDRKLDVEVRIALRLGILQLVFLDRIPQHAAVNDSVSLAVRAKKSSAKGLVNAVLRKIARGTPKLSFADDIERTSVETSHPGWLVEKWAVEFGFEKAASLAAANNWPPKIAFRLTPRALETDWTKNYKTSESVNGCFIADSLDLQLRERAEAGEIYFQDEASQMVAAAVEIPPNGRFLDVCAAPGGKTGAIAARSSRHSSAALLVAGDLHWQRVRFLQENLEKQGVSPVRVVQYNASGGLPFADETFDSILVDAPCSGTGTIRHNPEIRYFLEPGDLDKLQKTQLAILTNASKVLKQGGSLVYSTCSIEREENEAVVGSFLDENKDFELTRPNVAARFETMDGLARTYPDRDDMDGFFIAGFRRK